VRVRVLVDRRALRAHHRRPTGLAAQAAHPRHGRAAPAPGRVRDPALRRLPAPRTMAATSPRRGRGRRRPAARDGGRRQAGGRAMRRELRFGVAMIALVLLAVAWLTPWHDPRGGHVGLLMLATIVVAIMLGFPTAFTLMGMGVLFSFVAYARVDPGVAWQQTLDLMVQRAYSVMTNDVLIAIPLFVFMGYVVERSNLIERLFHSLHLALARLPGALAVATLATCAIFATATGIVGAVITLMGLIAMPAMLRAGYDVRVVAGAITAGGCLGVLIPPSVLLILYGATAGVSVVR